METVIQLIERIGQASKITAENFESMVQQSAVSEDLKQALIEKNVYRLEQLMGAEHNLMCNVETPEDEETKINLLSIAV